MAFNKLIGTSVGADLSRPSPIDRPSVDVPKSRWKKLKSISTPTKMKKRRNSMNQKVVKQIVVGIAALVLMVLFTACAGVGTTTTGGGTNLNVSGSVVSVDPVNHSVILSFNGQRITINGLTNDQVAFLQSQIGKGFSIQVTQNSNGTYNIENGTNLQADETPEANETPNSNETPNANEPGSVEFIGNVTSSGNGSIVVSMPNGSSLSMSTNGTNLEDFNGSLPGTGTRVSVEATANTDGSFTATKIKSVDSSDDPNQVKFQGVTTQSVGADRVIHFAVGNKSYSFTIPSTADLSDFGGNALSIASGVTVKVTVEYNGTAGTVTKVSQ